MEALELVLQNLFMGVEIMVRPKFVSQTTRLTMLTEVVVVMVLVSVVEV